MLVTSTVTCILLWDTAMHKVPALSSNCIWSHHKQRDILKVKLL